MKSPVDSVPTKVCKAVVMQMVS